MIPLDIWLQNEVLVLSSLILLIYINFKMLKASVHLRQHGHAKYFNQPFFFMNPADEEILVREGKIPKRTFALWGVQALVVFVSAFILHISVDPIFGNNLGTWVDWTKNTSWIPFACETVLGFILGGYIQSILDIRNQMGIFRFLKRNPTTLSGSLTLSSIILFNNARSGLKIQVILWLIISLFTLRGFFLGGVIRLAWLHFQTFKWERLRLSS